MRLNNHELLNKFTHGYEMQHLAFTHGYEMQHLAFTHGYEM